MPLEISHHQVSWAARVELEEVCRQWEGREQVLVGLCHLLEELEVLEEVACLECRLVVFLLIFRT